MRPLLLLQNRTAPGARDDARAAGRLRRQRLFLAQLHHVLRASVHPRRRQHRRLHHRIRAR